MSVIINKEQPVYCSYRTPDTTCRFCDRVLDYPFLDWDKLFICGPCCVTNKSSLMADPSPYVRSPRGLYRVDVGSKRGLLADLVHCAAIAELQALGYGGETLVRCTVVQAEQAGLAEQAERRRMEMEGLAELVELRRMEQPVVVDAVKPPTGLRLVEK